MGWWLSMAMTLVATTTVATTSSGLVSFTNIPQSGKDLLILGSVRTNRNATFGYLEFQLNAYGDSGRTLAGDGSSVSSYSAGYINAGNPVVNGANSTSNTFASVSAYVSNYTLSADKSVSIEAVGEANATESYQAISGGIKTTGAVTTLTARVEDDFFAAGTTFSLYIIS
jgi:hypothetical protein